MSSLHFLWRIINIWWKKKQKRQEILPYDVLFTFAYLQDMSVLMLLLIQILLFYVVVVLLSVQTLCMPTSCLYDKTDADFV